MQRRELLLSGAAASVATVASRAFAQAAAPSDKLIEWTDIPPTVPEHCRMSSRGSRWEDLDSDHAE